MQDVSVIMPARNVEGTIERAILSVLAEAAVLEIIVVEDGSTDTTADILERMAKADSRVVIVTGGNLGVTKGCNAGLAVARGKYYARCDADDWWKNDRLSWQRPFLEKNPEYVAVSGGFSTMTEKGALVANLASDGVARDQTEDLRNGIICSHLCTMLVCMDAVRAVNGMREWFFSAQDMDLQCRLAEIGKVWHEPRPVLAYVLHDASITHSLGTARRLFYQHSVGTFAEQRRDTGADDLMRGMPPVFDPDAEDQGVAISAAEHVANQLTGEGWRQFKAGNRRGGLSHLKRALLEQPMVLARWRNMAVMLVKSALR